MARGARVLMLLAFLLFSPARAWALPGPMSSTELLAASDLVAIVRVLAVTCVDVRKEQTGERLPSYRAELDIIQVRKGLVRKGDTVSVTWREIPKGLLGPWVVRYYPGEEVWTHLQRDPNGSGYLTTWWNARGEQVRPPDTTGLPKTPGQTVRAQHTAATD